MCCASRTEENIYIHSFSVGSMLDRIVTLQSNFQKRYRVLGGHVPTVSAQGLDLVALLMDMEAA